MKKHLISYSLNALIMFSLATNMVGAEGSNNIAPVTPCCLFVFATALAGLLYATSSDATRIQCDNLHFYAPSNWRHPELEAAGARFHAVAAFNPKQPTASKINDCLNALQKKKDQ